MNAFERLLREINAQVDIAYQAGGEDAMAGGLDNIEERKREALLMKVKVKLAIVGLIGKFIDEIFKENTEL